MWWVKGQKEKRGYQRLVGGEERSGCLWGMKAQKEVRLVGVEEAKGNIACGGFREIKYVRLLIGEDEKEAVKHYGNLRAVFIQSKLRIKRAQMIRPKRSL